jgi:hypothetical protein
MQLESGRPALSFRVLLPLLLYRLGAAGTPATDGKETVCCSSAAIAMAVLLCFGILYSNFTEGAVRHSGWAIQAHHPVQHQHRNACQLTPLTKQHLHSQAGSPNGQQARPKLSGNL